MSEFNTPKLPEVKFNKNGYEIRTDILAMAKDLVGQDFHVKFQGWEMTATRDEKTGQIISVADPLKLPEDAENVRIRLLKRGDFALEV